MSTQKQITEHPILFSGSMVRAILEGRKTQTRRVCKNAAVASGDHAWSVCPARESGWIAWFGKPSIGIEEFTKKAYTNGFECPYGKPGDRLWVRESFIYSEGTYCYEASTSIPCVPAHTSYKADSEDGAIGPWKPSIHMPRWASRINLETTEVRVQRVQDISEEDAKAEGCEFYIVKGTPKEKSFYAEGYRTSYKLLWDSINAKREGGKYAWDSNPWVWAITFKRM
jgi:hypothetical protein